MIPGAPLQSRWIIAEPRRLLPGADLRRVVSRALGDCDVLDLQPLTDGFRNANFKAVLDGRRDPIVIRIYEHDPSLCAKEGDILRLVSDTVPVPELVHAEPSGFDGLPPFAVVTYVEGISLRELKRGGQRDAIAQAAHFAGQILAAIGRFTFPRSGWLAGGLQVGDPLLHGADPGPRFVDLCLAADNLQARLPADLRERIHEHMWTWAPRLAALDDDTAHLVHCDFGGRNLLVRNKDGCWSIAAVLDWEFAVAGSPLADVGHFLRYERLSTPMLEPHFSNAFQDAGGVLPPDWRQLARVLDLTALCESLTHDHLPDDIVRELAELVRATIELRDPQL